MEREEDRTAAAAQRGERLRVEVPVDIALLGGEVEVPTLRGTRVKLRVPEGTQNGTKLRLKGLGMRSRCFFLKSNGGQVVADDPCVGRVQTQGERVHGWAPFMTELTAPANCRHAVRCSTSARRPWAVSWYTRRLRP